MSEERPAESVTSRASDDAAAPLSRLTADDLHLFNEGTHYRLYEKLGAHPMVRDGVAGTYFAVWAPNAQRVAVIGEFSRWLPDAHPLEPRGGSGIWEGFVPGIGPGELYKFWIESRAHQGFTVDKADPFAFRSQLPPDTASEIADLRHQWSDSAWMADRHSRLSLSAPVSIYEVHLGSWRRVMEEDNRSLTYRELGPLLADYCDELGFTHVELLPVMEHPFYGSWGYQTTGYFAPTRRYGTPEDLMWMVDHLHQRGVGVLLDWVPSHFPSDEHGLAYFDGTHLFEHEDPRLGFHPEWNSFIFNYGRHEVKSFLVSSAAFWLDRFHADGLRVDAVASMLYRNYARRDGEWLPNQHGGRENLEAVALLQALNRELYGRFADVQTFAEESTSWPGVSRPLYVGGLGFGYKWDMGWMHDSLAYLKLDPIHRRYHHERLTFRRMYAYSENFCLPLSHDEVVHGKRSLLGKMPGDEWQAFASLRLLFAWQHAQPGKKLLFMGGEFGQRREWNHDRSLDWHLLDSPMHRGVQRLVGDLNRLYRGEPAMHELDCDPDGFEWIDANDSEQSVVSLLRYAKPKGVSTQGEANPNGETKRGEAVMAVLNFTPIVRRNYRVGAPRGGFWREVLNTDAKHYGGSGQGNLGGVEAAPIPLHGRSHSLTLTLPPLGAVFLKAEAS
ncbi:MAG TPA: 1,4-alpha-glucan branching protein GlgB [Thermoanaerobaculia bacterium]|jgi:1,4-alpha-glucan branching enzyme|nr:1,4-alpha-glucan branching protein GlgB [Thermoanaerobaculia bacterium]